MKKIIALSLSLACAAAYAQEKSPTEKTAPEKSLKATTDQIVGKAPVCDCASKPAPIKKKVVKKVAKKTPVKPVVVAAPVVAPSSVLVGTDYYHVPDPSSTQPLDTWEKKITYDDVDVQVEKFEQVFRVSFVDKRTGKPLDSFSTRKLEVVDADVSAVSVRTDLSSSYSEKYNFGDSVASFGFNPHHKRGTCEAVYFVYQLKTQDEPKVVTKFLNQRGEVSDVLSSSCPRTAQDSRETTFYTKGGHIVNIGYNQHQMNQNKKLNFDAHFTKDGREFFPPDLVSYAISRDFSTLYHLQPNPNKLGAYFGVNFSKALSHGDYYLLMGFNYDKGTDWISNKVELR